MSPSREEQDLTRAELKERATKSSIILVVRQFVIRVLGIVSMLFLARLLTPEIFGLFAILQFTVMLLEEVIALGLPTALVRQKEHVTEMQLKQVFTLQLLTLGVCSLAMYLAAESIVGHYDLAASDKNAFYVMIVTLIFSTFKSIPKIILQRALRHDKIAVAEITEYLVYFVVAISLAYWGAGVWALVIAMVARSFSGAMILLVYSQWRFEITSKLGGLKKLAPFAFAVQVGRLTDIAGSALLPVVIGSLFGVSVLGIINMAKTLLDALIAQPINLVGRVQYRVFGALQSEAPLLKRSVDMALLAATTFAFMMVVGVFSVSGEVIGLILGEQWIGLHLPLQIMAVGYGFYAILVPTNHLMRAVGDAWTPTLITFLRLIVLLSVMLLFASGFGSLSYSLALSIAIPLSALTSFAVLFYSKKVENLSRVFLLPPLVAFGVVALIMQINLELSPMLNSLVIAVTATFLYAILVCLLVGKKLGDILMAVGQSAKNKPRMVKYLNRVATVSAAVSLRY